MTKETIDRKIKFHRQQIARLQSMSNRIPAPKMERLMELSEKINTAFSFPETFIGKKSNLPKLVKARKLFTFIARTQGFYFEEISSFLNVHYSTAMYHFDTFPVDYQNYPEYFKENNTVLQAYEISI